MQNTGIRERTESITHLPPIQAQRNTYDRIIEGPNDKCDALRVLKNFPLQRKRIDIKWNAIRRGPLGDFLVCYHGFRDDGREFKEDGFLWWTAKVSIEGTLEPLNVICPS